MTKILVVDDDPVQLRLTSAAAEKAGFTVLTAAGGQPALQLLRDDRNIGALVLDLVMPDLDGMGVMDAMHREAIKCPVIIQTANSSLDTVISAMREGAVDFFVKPVAPERLIISLRNALKMGQLEQTVRNDRARRDGKFGITDIIGDSAALTKATTLAAKAAKSNIPVLLEGESGAGKEVIARAIQGTSDRAGKPFVTVNCGAIPANLIESTLFGHLKGAFTGATGDHRGKFAEADGGTIFLDEIGELPLDAQVKLLRTLQDGTIEPVGSSKTEKVNVRLISATNRRLLNQTMDGKFREDLYYRLNVFPIYVPPLRDRREDIEPLAEHFLAQLSADTGCRVIGIGREALDLLKSYDWPGNVRQLQNAIYRALVLAEQAYLVPADFPQLSAALNGTGELRQQMTETATSARPMHIDDAQPDTSPDPTTHTTDPAAERFTSDNGDMRTLAEVERELIEFALTRHKGRMTSVAKALGIGRSTLYRKLKEYGLAQDTIGEAA